MLQQREIDPGQAEDIVKFERILAGYLAGEIEVEPLISHHLALDEVNRGFELMEAQDGIRSVIEFH